MSGGGYYYYYGQQPGGHLPETAQQSWGTTWPLQQQQQQQHYAAAAAGYSRSTGSMYSASPPSPTGQSSGYSQMRSQQQYHSSLPSSSIRGYQQRSGRYSNYNNDHIPQSHYGNRQQQNWHRNQKYKRTRSESGESVEPKSKGPKKKKKPLSQNVPSKKEWTLQDAELALGVEKECNKRFKNQSLLIKFPDLELNKEIVSKFHPAIENVHFQQPSAPRFCFVTLNESADTDAVIKELSKQKFGDGYITAEYKKDREDDQNVGPEDIDPTTLYVGNLAQEITKEDMVKTFPKVRRIDIGYAKKMKYTRYAFVSFSTVADAVEAFKKTHSTQLYSKSLIVRFRRLCGPVGMPGETKQQNPQKTPVKDNTEITATEMNGSTAKDPAEQIENTEDVNHSFIQEATSPFSVNNDSLSRSPQYSERHDIKYEPDDSDDDYESKFNVKSEIERDLFSNTVSDIFANHKPKMKTEIKSEVKTEPEERRNLPLKQEPVEEVDVAASSAIETRREGITANVENAANVKSDSGEIFRVDGREVIVKEEPREDSDSENSHLDEEGRFLGVRDFASLYNSMIDDGGTVQKSG